MICHIAFDEYISNNVYALPNARAPFHITPIKNRIRSAVLVSFDFLPTNMTEIGIKL